MCRSGRACAGAVAPLSAGAGVGPQTENRPARCHAGQPGESATAAVTAVAADPAVARRAADSAAAAGPSAASHDLV